MRHTLIFSPEARIYLVWLLVLLTGAAFMLIGYSEWHRRRSRKIRPKGTKRSVAQRKEKGKSR